MSTPTNGHVAALDPVQRVLDALTRHGCDPRPTGAGRWESRCPVHKGARRNLSIRESDSRAVLLRCHHVDDHGRCCPSEAIVAAVGLEMRDLFPALPGSNGTGPGKPKRSRPGTGFESPRAAAEFLARKESATIAGCWVYHDADRRPYAAVYRIDSAEDKTYRPVSRDPETGHWRPKDPAQWLPYHAEDIAAASRVYILEGEKCCDLARGLDLVAITTAHGAQSPHKTDLSSLAGKEVVIIPDHDKAGEGYASKLLGLLGQVDPRPTVRVLRLPDLADDGDDIEQWLQRLPDTWDAEKTRDQIEALAAAVAPWDFDQAPAPSNPVDDLFDGLSDEDLGLLPLASVQCRPIRWHWKYRLSAGGLSMMAGDGGIGKSQLLLFIAAATSTGGELPDGSGNAPIGDVVIVSAEDRPDDTIKPRLLALGADLSRITIVRAKYVLRKPGKPPEVHPTSFQDLSYWKAIFRRRPACRLFIVDPLPSYLGRGVNDSKNVEIRNILEPFLDEIIAPHDICMIGNTHLNKTVDAKTPMHRISGSIAYGALPRNVHFVVRDPEDPERRFFKQAKCNNAPDDLPALAFRVEKREIKIGDGAIIETAIPVFEDKLVHVDLRNAVNGEKASAKRGPDPAKTMKAAEWLYDYLDGCGGTSLLAAIFDDAGAVGLIGEKGSDGKWSGVRLLYTARDRISQLPEPRNGKRIEDFKAATRDGGRELVHWYLTDDSAAF